MRTDDSKNRSRKKNLYLFDLREGAEGTRPLLDFVEDMLPKWLELSADQSLVLERVHHTVAPPKPNHHRVVLIHLWKFQDWETVYHLSSQRNILHEGAKLAFVQDFSAETMRLCHEFSAPLFFTAGDRGISL